MEDGPIVSFCIVEIPYCEFGVISTGQIFIYYCPEKNFSEGIVFSCIAYVIFFLSVTTIT